MIWPRTVPLPPSTAGGTAKNAADPAAEGVKSQKDIDRELDELLKEPSDK